jgi:hypothetical protein
LSHSVGYGLDESAAISLTKTRFTPATNRGTPVPFRTDIEVAFRSYWYWQIEVPVGLSSAKIGGNSRTIRKDGEKLVRVVFGLEVRRKPPAFAALAVTSQLSVTQLSVTVGRSPGAKIPHREGQRQTNRDTDR